MNLIMETCFKVLLTVLLIISASFVANAQKLPKVQQESIYAPTNIKIDGKATEWDNKFQAYNVSNHLFYTLSNDDKNLYLIVFATDDITYSKIIYGGVTLTVADIANKKNKITVTYPVSPMSTSNSILLSAHHFDFVANNGKEALMNSINSHCAAAFKEIKVSGIKGIDDPVSSIYNAQGIKATVLFDNKMAFTYELALPLKYLDFATDHFRYNIMLNGRTLPEDPRISYPPNYLDSPTDFSGEYTLAKK